MKKEKTLGYVEVVGETMVAVGAAMWLPLRDVAMYVFCAGVVLFAVGRFVPTPFYQKYSVLDPKELTLRRLYHQRVLGMVALILTAALMCVPIGFHFGVYVGPASWLLPFAVFAVIEVYTAFRISSLEKG